MKLYAIKDNLFKYCNLFISDNIQLKEYYDHLIDTLSNNGKTIFYLLGNSIQSDNINDVIQRINLNANDYVLFANVNNINCVNNIKSYISNLYVECDEQLLENLSNRKILRIYNILKYSDKDSNVGKLTIYFKVNKNNISKVYSSVKFLTENNIQSFIDFEHISKSSCYRYCQTKDNDVVDNSITYQLIFDKMIREKLNVVNLNYLIRMCNYLPSNYKCECCKNITIDEKIECNLCPLIKGYMLSNINPYTELIDYDKLSQKYIECLESDYKRFCDGCNNALVIYQQLEGDN